MILLNSILSLFFIVLASYSLGSLAIYWFKDLKKDYLIIKQVLGLGLIGFFIFLMGLIQIISTTNITFFLCLCTIVGVFL